MAACAAAAGTAWQRFARPLALAACCSVAVASAGAPTAAPEPMPSAFRLEALTIRLTRQDGNAAYAPWQVTLSGADGGSLELDGSSRRFAFAGKDLVALLNELFECRFFDMPATYDRRKVAQLNPDGTVSLIGNFTSNATGNGICVEVGRFEKCVRYGNEGPVELSRIFNRVFADAERLSGVR